MSDTKPSTTMFEYMSRSIDIAQLEKAKIPEAILLSKSVGHLIKIVVEDSKGKASYESGDTSNYALFSMMKLHKLLETKTAFLLPYRYYFYIKNVLYGIPEEEDRHHILKLPVRAFCSKEVGLRLYGLLVNHFGKYFPKETEMTYVIGKAIDSMWISESLFHIDKYLIKEKLPNINGECEGITEVVAGRMETIKERQRELGVKMPRGTLW